MDIIKVQKRDETKKAKQLRRSGQIPCNVYGGTLSEPVSIQIDEKTAGVLCHTKREGSTIQLDLDGKRIPVQIKDKVINTLSNAVEHISFQALQADQKVNSVTHIFLKNAELVPGLLEQVLYEIPFASLPKDMVDTVTIDLEGLPVGTMLTVKDIPELQKDTIALHIPDDSLVLQIKERFSANTEEA